MKKVLLLENIEERQNGLDIDFSKYGFLDNILGDKDCNSLLNGFLENPLVFSKYDTIIIHESIYYDSKRGELFKRIGEFCKEKKLVKFSGHNSQFSFENELSLSISPKDLYKNLEIFLEAYIKNCSNTLMLALGENWYLNILLNSLEKLNIFIENNTKNKIHKAIFSSKAGLSKIKEVSPESYIFLFSGIETNLLTEEQVRNIRDNLKKLIQDKINE